MVMWLVLSRVESNNCGCVSLGLVSESGGRVKDHRFVWIVLGKFKCRKLVTIKIRNLYMNKSVEALISFNKGNQGLLKLHVLLGWLSFSMGEKRGLCYVPLLQGSPVLAGLHYRNLIFGIWCYSVILLIGHWWPNG